LSNRIDTFLNTW